VIFDIVVDYLRGEAVTIPPMDGPLRPNTVLDDIPALLEIEAPDNLAFDGQQILFSSGLKLFALSAAVQATRIAHLYAPVTALAAAPGGGVAVATDDGRILLKSGAHDQTTLQPADFGGLACPTALAFADADTLFVCQGSSAHPASDWVIDLMERNASGSVWRVDLAKGSKTCLAQDLAFPHGLLVPADGKRVILSESWRHRLTAIGTGGGTPQPVLTKLPGYPSRLAPAEDGGAWLCLFAPRNRLIEFVLEEGDYRAAMMREIAREHWIAPALSSGASFLEPLQCGGVKTMGLHKPWSPSRSCGLLVRLDRNLRPVASFHSRANGRRHGITSAIAREGRVLVTAKGGNAILDLGASS
jgi:strictosidine synthase-like protein